MNALVLHIVRSFLLACIFLSATVSGLAPSDRKAATQADASPSPSHGSALAVQSWSPALLADQSRWTAFPPAQPDRLDPQACGWNDRSGMLPPHIDCYPI